MRTGKVIKRLILPDAKYDSKLLSKFINRIMRDGKKSVAQRLVYNALDIIKETTKADPLVIFETAIRNIAPKLEVRPRRVGGASYQVPVEVRGDRKETLAIRWIIAAATAKPNKEYHSFGAKLAVELIDAANNAGGAIKKRDDVLRMANANRAFSHFRW